MREVADGLPGPNGMALIDEGRTLIVADSHAGQLVAFEVAGDGALGGRRVWAGLEHAPDGICADADGAVWVASVPGQRCVRVREAARCSTRSPSTGGALAACSAARTAGPCSSRPRNGTGCRRR
jgi:sugar lactone lactonase YvrE